MYWNENQCVLNCTVKNQGSYICIWGFCENWDDLLLIQVTLTKVTFGRTSVTLGRTIFFGHTLILSLVDTTNYVLNFDFSYRFFEQIFSLIVLTLFPCTKWEFPTQQLLSGKFPLNRALYRTRRQITTSQCMTYLNRQKSTQPHPLTVQKS